MIFRLIFWCMYTTARKNVTEVYMPMLARSVLLRAGIITIMISQTGNDGFVWMMLLHDEWCDFDAVFKSMGMNSHCFIFCVHSNWLIGWHHRDYIFAKCKCTFLAHLRQQLKWHDDVFSCVGWPTLRGGGRIPYWFRSAPINVYYDKGIG